MAIAFLKDGPISSIGVSRKASIKAERSDVLNVDAPSRN